MVCLSPFLSLDSRKEAPINLPSQPLKHIPPSKNIQGEELDFMMGLVALSKTVVFLTELSVKQLKGI